MRTSDKVLLVLLALVNYAIAILVILSEFIKIDIGRIGDMLYFSLRNDALETACLVFFIILTLVIGTSLLTIVRRSSGYRQINRNDTVSLSDDGDIKITFEALRSMTKKKCMTYRFISDCTTDVDIQDGVLTLYVRLRPTPETLLTESLNTLRNELIESVEQQTGLYIKNVQMLVLPYKARKNQ